MELEITIRVPLGASGVSVEQHATDPVDATPSDAGSPAPPSPPPGARAGANGDESAPADGAAAHGGHGHVPPSPEDFGLTPGGPPEEIGPPSIEMTDRVIAEAATAAGQPPGLDELGLPDVLGHDGDAASGPPDLPDPSQVPDVSSEFAPPPIEDVEASAPRGTPRDAGGSTRKRG
jgi:hypothetical protein